MRSKIIDENAKGDFAAAVIVRSWACEPDSISYAGKFTYAVPN